MIATELLHHLSRPESYPGGVKGVEVIQTHISFVFLCEEVVYKIRKPVRFGFLDFSTLEKRRLDCEEEVRLNRRLAPKVYLGVVPVTRADTGFQVEGDGEVVEWAVKMIRLPIGTTALDFLQRGELTEAQVHHLARIIAEFHRRADSGPAISDYGRFSVVARNTRENFEQTESHVGTTVRREVFDRVRSLSDSALKELEPLIESRAARGVPRDTHGDLHLDHIYLFPDRPPPEDVVAIDCIEFNERFRFADPIADMSFLVMDLCFRGRRDLAERFATTYFEASGDGEGTRLLPFYTAYRSVVRAKVEGLAVGEVEIAEVEREKLCHSAQGHWLLALNELEMPSRRSMLLLFAGLPGTGKSTLARELQEDGFEVIRTDMVRKELFHGPESGARNRHDPYSPEKTQAVYRECLRRSREFLLNGKRVLVDANFREESNREPFLELANQLSVPILLAVCEASPEIVRTRLAQRRGDVSDADWGVYQWATSRWEEPGASWRPHSIRISTDTGTDRAAERLRSRLREDRYL